MNLVDAGVPVISRCKKITPVCCWVSLALCSVGAALFSLPPSTVQAAGAPAFLFDATKTFDSLTPRAARKVAPNFTLTDNNGKIVTLSNYKGKVVLLDFWATWCGGYKLEIPWYMGFDREVQESGPRRCRSLNG